MPRDLSTEDPIAVSAVHAVALRAPLDVPIRTSFGEMRDRPAVLVQVADESGHRGIGEVWCNFPSVGAEHRARLALEIVGPTLVRLSPMHVHGVFFRLMEALHILALQSGEWGPLRQVAAGFDTACHDLAARRAGLPLYAYLGGSTKSVRVYASGIGPAHVEEVVRREQAAGHDAFKLKVGFGEETDTRTLEAARSVLGDGPAVMIDANQAWNGVDAIRMASLLARYDLAWIEEPIPADSSADEWGAVAAAVSTPLAAGENMNSTAEFEAAIADGHVQIVQPDVAKWGGVSGALTIARRATSAGLVYCPHYLGGGVGLLTSAHVLAAAEGNGRLEVDTNPNPWRERFAPDLSFNEGRLVLDDRPGLGIASDVMPGP